MQYKNRRLDEIYPKSMGHNMGPKYGIVESMAYFNPQK